MTWSKSWGLEDWSFEDLAYRLMESPDPDTGEEDEQITLISRRE